MASLFACGLDVERDAVGDEVDTDVSFAARLQGTEKVHADSRVKFATKGHDERVVAGLVTVEVDGDSHGDVRLDFASVADHDVLACHSVCLGMAMRADSTPLSRSGVHDDSSCEASVNHDRGQVAVDETLDDDELVTSSFEVVVLDSVEGSDGAVVMRVSIIHGE